MRGGASAHRNADRVMVYVNVNGGSVQRAITQVNDVILPLLALKWNRDPELMESRWGLSVDNPNIMRDGQRVAFTVTSHPFDDERERDTLSNITELLQEVLDELDAPVLVSNPVAVMLR